MEMIAKYLRQFLTHNDLAYIPGLGIFEAVNLKAEMDPSKKEMLPPRRVVKFKQQSSKDLSFIEFLAKLDGKSNEAIKKELTDWVNELKKVIVAKKKVDLEGLGILGLNAAKKVAFKALPDLNISPETSGFKPVKAEVVSSADKTKESKKPEPKKEETKKEEKAVPAAKKEDTPKKVEEKKAEEKKVEEKKPEVKKEEPKPKPSAKKEEEKKRSPFVLVGIILLIVAIAAAAGFYFLKLNKHEEPAVVEKPVVVEDTVSQEEVVEDTVTAEPEPVAEPEPTVTISEKSGRYYVIANSFEFEENAYKFREQVMAKGAESKIILPDERIKLYRVSVAESDDFESAVTKMEESRAEFGNTVWVLIY